MFSDTLRSLETSRTLSWPPIIAALAQLERSLIVERVKAGLRRARAEGKRLGRPPLQVDDRRLESVVRRRLPVRAAARELGISPSSYLRLLHARRHDQQVSIAG